MTENLPRSGENQDDLAKEAWEETPEPVADEAATEPAEETPEETPEPVADEAATVPAEEAPEETPEPVAEEAASEPVEETPEETPEPIADEAASEPAEETPEETPQPVAEEAASEPVEKALEETPEPVADEAASEPVEETPEETLEPIADEAATEPAEEAPEETAKPVADEAASEPAEKAPEEAADIAPAEPEESKSRKRGKKKGKKKRGDVIDDPDAITMPLMEHLRELRTRLFRASLALMIATIISFAFARFVLQFLIAPMGDTMPQALKPTESLGNYMKVALICGLTLSMPFIVYQIGRFLAPGLTKSERRWLIVLVPGATLSFVAGVAFAYFIMLPSAIPFLQGFMADIVAQQWALGEYLSFVISLMLWIGIAFELPLFTFFLAKIGIIDAQMLSRNRKYAIVLIAIAAAVITPTVDPVNMALVMGPLVILYELGIILAKLA